ncbi:SRPBCC domain-containing protein [Niveibacterium sp. SC-1]|uniref:SRPBCC domain-containing protein n=1 Tax=Niveibacterium sp. SC-1 TaxID=3135646 RepID=UPI00311DA0D5
MSATDSGTDELAVRVTQRFTAPAERVFDAWLDPEGLTRWMFGPATREEEIARLQIDPRVGGGFSFRVRRAGTLLDHVGKYMRLERPHHIEFSWGMAGESDSLVSVHLAPTAQGCELELTHYLDPAWRDFAERTRSGWARMLDLLDRNLYSAQRTEAMPAQSFGWVDAAHVLHMERLLPAPPAQAWNWFAERAPRAHWLAEGDLPLEPGSAIELIFDHAELSPYVLPAPDALRRHEGSYLRGRLLACEPPGLLALSWGDTPEAGEARFVLSPRGQASVLELTHSGLADPATRVDVAAGWHTHLAMLTARMQGAAPPAFWPLYVVLHKEYALRLAAA